MASAVWRHRAGSMTGLVQVLTFEPNASRGGKKKRARQHTGLPSQAFLNGRVLTHARDLAVIDQQQEPQPLGFEALAKMHDGTIGQHRGEPITLKAAQLRRVRVR